MKDLAKEALLDRLDYHIEAIAGLLAEKPESHIIILANNGETFDYDVFSYESPEFPKMIVTACKRTCPSDTAEIEKTRDD